MAETLHRPALASARTGQIGATRPAGVTLVALPERTILQVLAAPGAAMDASALTAAFPGTTLRTAGPGQWFVLSETPLATAALPGFRLIDQSHGRVPIALSGPMAADALAKGMAIDLDRLGIGQSALTLIGHLAVHLTRTAGDGFELLVTRSFAEALWDDLIVMGREFGIEAIGPSA